MKMGEFDMKSIGLTEEHATTMDELLPGWRDLTPVEFSEQMRQRAKELDDESRALRNTLDQLGGGDR